MFILRKDNEHWMVVKDFLAVVAKLSHLLILLMDCSLALVLAAASFFFERALFSRGHNAHCAAGQDRRAQLSTQRSVCRRIIPKFQRKVRQ